MIIYNTYPPEAYGNLKTLCNDLKVSYHTYKAKTFPFKIGNIEVFKVEVKKGGGRKRKEKDLTAQCYLRVTNFKHLFITLSVWVVGI